MKQTPTIGRIVHYTLSSTDAAEVNRRRADFRRQNDPGRTGFVGHVGNDAYAGDVYPATIVRTFEADMVNLQVSLDGNDTFWATSRQKGTEPGTWAWPERV